MARQGHQMRSNSTCPIYVDGSKVCEAPNVSYTVEQNVTHSGVGNPNRPSIVDRDPPEYDIEIETPGAVYFPIDHESRVEIAIPPSVHGGTSWRVLEVWEINAFEQTEDMVSLSAWEGDIHTGVDYLGFDTDETVNDTRSAPNRQKTLEVLSEEGEDDGDFEAEVHDI